MARAYHDAEMKFARRRDVNERAIIDALRAKGAAVAQLEGSGVPDLVVEYEGRLLLVEVKDINGTRARPIKGKHDDEDPRYRELTPAQVQWWKRWTGIPPVIVRSVEDALRALEVPF